MILIPAGNYTIGNDKAIGFSTDNEMPLTEVEIREFYIDETQVSNQEFKEFVDATGYVTEAEEFKWSYVFYGLYPENSDKKHIIQNLSWWLAVEGANWKQPEGPDSTIEDRMDHPVIQVSRRDALAYAKWAGKRLPTEIEWEIAAKGGTDNTIYPWGDDGEDIKYEHANTWQGDFPNENSVEDGFYGTAPVKTFEPNGFGLYQMIGNVWEWCLNRPDNTIEEQLDPKSLMEKLDEDEKNLEGSDEFLYATRGGSFLCHKSYCRRDRIASRNKNTGNSATSNQGFRCVKDV